MRASLFFVILTSTLSLPALALFRAQPVSTNDRIADVTVQLEYVQRIHIADGVTDLTFPLSTCSGSLIRQDVVLTAAHCVDDYINLPDKTGKEFAVRYINKLTGQTQKAKALTVAMHPSYGGQSGASDIGLVLLETPITDRTPIPLFTKNNLPSRFEIIVAGWGKTSMIEEEVQNDELLNAYLEQLKAIDQNVPAAQEEVLDLANRVISRLNEVVDSHSQLLQGKKSAKVISDPSGQMIGQISSKVRMCPGDSGGPSFVQTQMGLYQVGIHSSGFESNCSKGLANAAIKILVGLDGFDTFIPAVNDWLQNTLISWGR